MNGAPAIQVQQLVKRFGSFAAVQGLDLQVEVGECVALLGPNGAGKTTTIEILEGLQTATEGTVRLFGLNWKDDERALRSRVGVQLQDTRFYERLNVFETLRLFASFYPDPEPVESLLGRVQLEKCRTTQVKDLSGGQRQRLALATALAGRPDLLFLDEPSSGLDPQSRHALWDVIKEFKRSGKTVMLTTHYLEEAEQLSDRVVVVDHGRAIAGGTLAQLVRQVGATTTVELVSDPPLSREALEGIPGLHSVQPQGRGWTMGVHQLQSSLPAILAAVGSNPGALQEMSVRRPTLEDVFLSLTGRSLREDAASASVPEPGVGPPPELRR